jgi:amino acid transporter
MSVPDSVVPTGPKGSGSITVASATAIGVGGMMGAGLYTLVGLASTTAGVWLPLAFLVGGVVTVFSVYSYAKLGARYPSRGGAAQFLIKCFGDGVIAGGLNVFQFLGWIIAMALYCAGFAGYLRALLPWHTGVVRQGDRHRAHRCGRGDEHDRNEVRRQVRNIRRQYRVGDPCGVRGARSDPRRPWPLCR